MKLKNILYTGLAALSLTACNDYLDVDAPSSYTTDFVFSHKSEMQRALNGVYAKALVNDLYGNAYQKTFILNSDVDMQISSSSAHSHTSYSRFDCDDQGGDINKFWNAAYSLIEECNKFISYSENSSIYDEEDKEMTQWIGEAKCLRAMIYHDLVVMFGDVPFTMVPASSLGGDFNIPVFDRQVIQDSIINDLVKAAPKMSVTKSVTVERCSKEFAEGMIARIALTAGGYSLRPDKNDTHSYGVMKRPDNYLDYYHIAMEHAGNVIMADEHHLNNDFRDVFIKECNFEVVNDDDPIFEIPFAKQSTGNTGYIQGPSYKDNNGTTVGPWGKCDGSVRLNAFYRFHFADGDVRREFVNGLWDYDYYTNADGVDVDTVKIMNDYTVHNNKWSKLWSDYSNAGSNFGSDKSGSTGINYPYMRYADILLMFAEASNELYGPTKDGINAFRQVRERAFRTNDTGVGVNDGPKRKQKNVDEFILTLTDKETFQNAILNERKFEFAGENMRWRDLVRTNKYAEELVYSFLRYYSVGAQNVSSLSGYEDAINEHDGLDYIEKLPTRIYYHEYDPNIEPRPLKDGAVCNALVAGKDQLYGCTVGGMALSRYLDRSYPNRNLKSLRILNAYKVQDANKTSASTYVKGYGFTTAPEFLKADFYQWGNESTGTPRDQCKYSFYGFARSDESGNLWLVSNGVLIPMPQTIEPESLPVVRYILPYPNSAIQQSAGVYKNYYGY